MNHHTLKIVLKDRKLFRKALTCFFLLIAMFHKYYIT